MGCRAGTTAVHSVLWSAVCINSKEYEPLAKHTQVGTHAHTCMHAHMHTHTETLTANTRLMGVKAAGRVRWM